MFHHDHPLNRRSLLKAAGAVAAGPALLVHDARAQSAMPVTLTTGLKLANYGPIYVAQRAGLF
jgi:NitT/TauT family transport system substrate-binding protein